MLMRENSTLINSVRLELIEEGALIKCLKKDKPAFLGLDVYDTEPILNKDYEFLTFPNVVCTPHLGYLEKNGDEQYLGKAFENVINYINGKPTNIANPEVL